MAEIRGKFIKQINQRYESYHVKQIQVNRFTHTSLLKALEPFTACPQLTFKQIGESEEGRSIHKITFGKGKTKLLFWSQMHGNESTATRALLDILKFLVADDAFNEFRKQLAKELTLQFIPMLNPDGTQRFQRRTATGIDMNRDALALQTLEGRLLMQQVDELKPHFAFNLHDQRRFYNVKGSSTPSSLSFLAPAYNANRTVNTTRKAAMQVIAAMNKAAQAFIPGGTGLYDDTFSERSFGDQIQAKGVSTILVESGWLPNDIQKEGVRKLNFLVLMQALETIATGSYTDIAVQHYEAIPPIDTKLFDVLIKNVNLPHSSSQVDIGINRTEHLLAHPQFYSKGTIEDIGDLSAYEGFSTLDATGLSAIPGKVITLADSEGLSFVTAKRLLRQGVLFVTNPNPPAEPHLPLPINWVHPSAINKVSSLAVDAPANFLLLDKHNNIKYRVVNGFLVKGNSTNSNINGVVFVE